MLFLKLCKSYQKYQDNKDDDDDIKKKKKRRSSNTSFFPEFVVFFAKGKLKI